MLLSRQALELSLYTFKYVDDVNSVIVFLPPSTEGQSNGSMFLRRGDVADELRAADLSASSRARTAPGRHSAQSSWATSLRLTRPRTYAFEFNAGGDGKPILILTPPTAGS